MGEPGGRLVEWVRARLRLHRETPVAAAQMRWVVLDCESSGLDPRRDRLLSIGAVSVEHARIALDSGHSVVLRQDAASAADNIVIHGIAGGEQLGGMEAASALRAFEGYVAGAPLVAFHAAFDRSLLERAARANQIPFRHVWLDLAALAPALYPARAARCKALDDWLDAFGVESLARHDALGDAYATAQLFQILLPEAARQGAAMLEELLVVASGQRWLGGG